MTDKATTTTTTPAIKKTRKRVDKTKALTDKGPKAVTRALTAIARVGALAKFGPTTEQTTDIVTALQGAVDTALGQLQAPPPPKKGAVQFTFTA